MTLPRDNLGVRFCCHIAMLAVAKDFEGDNDALSITALLGYPVPRIDFNTFKRSTWIESGCIFRAFNECPV